MTSNKYKSLELKADFEWSSRSVKTYFERSLSLRYCFRAVLEVKKSIIGSVICRTLSWKSSCWLKLNILAVSPLSDSWSLAFIGKLKAAGALIRHQGTENIFSGFNIPTVLLGKGTVNVFDSAYSFCSFFVEYLTKVVRRKLC